MRVFDRLRWPGLLVGALAFALMGCGGGGGSDASDAEESFTVVQEIPTNGQEVSGDLSDVGGALEIKFSTELDETTIYDPTEPHNRLSSDLNMLDSQNYRVSGSPDVKGKYFRFIPPSGTDLAPQQYTVTVSTNIKSKGGQTLREPFYSSFTVGPDVYEPVIRSTVPVQNQPNVPRNEELVITFNESLDATSVNPQTVLVQDGGVNPPVTINGLLTLENHGFEIHFTPDPAAQMPANTTVIVTLQGGTGGISDATGGTPFLASQEVSGNPPPTYVLQFNTTAGGDPINQFALGSCYFIDQKSFGVIDIGAYTGIPPIANSNGRQVLDNSRRKIGTPTDIVIDPRVNGNGDTFAYIVDLNDASVAVVNTFNSRVVGRVSANSPRGVGIETNGNVLIVSEYASDSVQFFNIALASPGTNSWNTSGTVEGNGSAIKTKKVSVGRGPYGVAVSPAAYIAFVPNFLEGTCSIVNTTTETLAATWQVGANPVDAACSVNFPGIGYFALVTNLGGGASDPGSASLWWSSYPNNQQWLLTGLQNPRGVTYDYGVNFYVANSGGNTVTTVQIAVAGNTIVPTTPYSFHTGKGPQSVALDPVNLVWLFTADMGDGIVTVLDTTDPSNVLQPYIPVPGVRGVATLVNQ